MRRIGTESPYRTRGEHEAVFFLRYVELIEKRTHVDVPCKLRILLAGRRKKGDKVHDGIDSVLFHCIMKPLGIQGIELYGPCILGHLCHIFVLNIGCNHIVVSVNFLKMRNQFGSDLSAGSYYQYTFHICKILILIDLSIKKRTFALIRRKNSKKMKTVS